ncbi:hypothetical protein EPIB1_2056 [Tritonibacter mobilis]|nr:hypothetical protein SCH4B_4147 [Ruegeria sp. TrichCH4B]VCU59158.1 hypothetical protein EPIB1_2056 [Tritonibacter mobilis]
MALRARRARVSCDLGKMPECNLLASGGLSRHLPGQLAI